MHVLLIISKKSQSCFEICLRETNMRMEYVGGDEHTHVHGQHKRSKSNTGQCRSMESRLANHIPSTSIGRKLEIRPPICASGTYHASRGGDLHSREEWNKSMGLRSEARSISPHSPLHAFSSRNNTDVSTEQRNSLEKDVEQLQMRLQQEKSMRMFLERALGRTSSTLSPGHRHSANKTKELVAEIELLEEEVVNREQHVLSLYRTIFEQCVSRPSSQQSSVLTSPAHAKKESRKHPTIISSSFCSSKSFPCRSFHALSTMNTPGKGNLMQSKTRHASRFRSKANSYFETTCSDDFKSKGNPSATKKRSVQLTLKDHLYQCPSRLSEEMVKSMAAVYCWLRCPSSTDLEHKKSSSLSTNVVLPRRSNGEERKSMVEISWISTDKNNFSRASYAINNYRHLVEQLERMNLSQMETDAQTAFWINMYNSMIMHAYLAYGIPHSSLRRLALFHKAAYKIGGHIISANAIEQAIFRFRTPRVGKWLETILSTALWKKSGEERQRIGTKFGLKYHQPLLCFALCSGTSSDPVLKVYTPSSIKEELEAAKKEFLESNIIVKKSKKVFIPKLLERFGKEANISPDNLVTWITENVDRKLGDSIEKCMKHKGSKKIIEWLPYNSRFRYVFSKDLSEKPWWV